MEKIEINDTENIPVEIIDTRREIDNLSDAELKELEKKLEQYDKDSWQYAEYLEKFKHITLFFSAPESMSKRLRNCIRGKIPKVDAVRDVLSGIDPEEVRKIHEETVDTLKKNRIFRESGISKLATCKTYKDYRCFHSARINKTTKKIKYNTL